jgi:Uncharacterized conserved protein (DUF2075)
LSTLRPIWAARALKRSDGVGQLDDLAGVRVEGEPVCCSNRRANRDPDFRNSNTVSDARFDALVRNVYKVLLTLGMVGTVIYSTDAETRNALRRLVP